MVDKKHCLDRIISPYVLHTCHVDSCSHFEFVKYLKIWKSGFTKNFPTV